MGIAHHANYLVWFEIGRTDFCRAAGLSYRVIEERGLLLVVTEARCRYRSPFRYDDDVVIRTRIGALGSRALRFQYELLSDQGAMMASGHSSHVWLERESRRPVVAPRELLERFREFGGSGRRHEATLYLANREGSARNASRVASLEKK